MDYGLLPGEVALRARARAGVLAYRDGSEHFPRGGTVTSRALEWSLARPEPQRMTTLDDRHWLELARAGDRAAFGKLIRQYQQRIHRLAFHLTGNVGEADDVTQETFLRAYRAIGRFDGRADVYTWLYRICVNVALNLRRQRRRTTADLYDPRTPEPVAHGTDCDPADALARAQAYRELARAMDGLSEALRTTLVLACVEQLPYAEIAQVLGCSEGTVAWRVHEARRRLREALGEAAIEALEKANGATKGGVRGRGA